MKRPRNSNALKLAAIASAVSWILSVEGAAAAAYGERWADFMVGS